MVEGKVRENIKSAPERLEIPCLLSKYPIVVNEGLLSYF